MIRQFLKKHGFVLLFMVILFYPVYGGLSDRFIDLHGVSESSADLSAGSLMDGSRQSVLNTAFEENFPGRKLLIRLRNQLLYLCGVSPNSNVVIGKDRCLFEPADILYDSAYYPPCSEEYFDTLGKDLADLQRLLAESGKELYVFVTPYKPRFCRDKIPASYEFLSAREYYPRSNTDLLLAALQDHGIPYYNAGTAIERALEEGPAFKAPVFAATGKHWTRPWGAFAADGLLDFIRSESRFRLGETVVEESASPVPVFPDADLYDTFNLFSRPAGEWYDASLTVTVPGTDRPGIFARGGSFMGQSISYLLEQDLFGWNVHFENDHYACDSYSTMDYISGYTAYDEADMKALLGPADIVLLEVNEGSIDRMGFGLVQYILEHPECVRN